MCYKGNMYPFGDCDFRFFTMLRTRVVRATPKIGALRVVRHKSLPAEPKEVFTKVNDSLDPQRNQFFQYTWGSWMKNDKVERAKRQTKFSIEGITSLVQEVDASRKDAKNVDGSGEVFLRKPLDLGGANVLLNNTRLLGDTTEALLVKSIASIHEGKHHRIYKVTLSTGKDLVLRIPYKLESDHGIEAKIRSEVATLDFLDLKLGLNVPKVVAYGVDRNNKLESPFILMEYIEGDLLMRQWDPLVEDGNDAKLKEVIDPIVEFQDKLLSVTFNKHGSLYFHDDVPVEEQSAQPYAEENPLLKDRWRIGPSVEKSFLKNKNKLSAKQVRQHAGPWTNPVDVLTSVANIELEALRTRLGLVETESSVEDPEQIRAQITTFEHLQKISPLLLNPQSKAVMNVEDLFQPRLYAPDLDPLNVIVRDGKHYFVDFEYTTIKPFIYTSYPAFVSYQGAKIYNLEEDVPGYAEMDDVEKQQYQFMYYKTRNERLWELALNEKRHDLIAVASPHIKVLKSPYIQALDVKGPKDHLYVEGSIVQLQAMWEAYVTNGLCNTEDTAFPIEYSAEYLDAHQTQLEEYQLETVSTPFAATGGWVPQDMFEKLREQGIIVEDTFGNYKVETEAALAEEN